MYPAAVSYQLMGILGAVWKSNIHRYFLELPGTAYQ